MNWDSFLDGLAEWFEKRELLTPGTPWVVGVSGGPDSTLLLHAMQGVSARRDLGWKLHAAHFNHGLRGAEADADERFVTGLSEQLGAQCHVDRADIRACTERDGGSTEEIARRHRYEMLARVALKAGSEHVAVAHHADDNAETVLHRICRGTGLRGLAGISEVRPIRSGSRVQLVRPLLGQRRATIDEMCAARGFETRADSTNASGEFTRNRIRNTVLPMLRENLNPNVTEALLRLAEQARWLGGYLEGAAARTFESLVVAEKPHHLVLSATALAGKHRAIQSEIVRRAVALVTGAEPDLSFAHVDALLRLANDGASGKELHLPGRIIASKRYDRLEFHPLESDEEQLPELSPVLVEVPGRTPLPSLGIELHAEVCEIDASKVEELRRDPPANEEWLGYDQLQLPLVVRARREGDRFHPLGAPGAKSLSDFLAAEKIDPQLRARTGILCDQAGPIWVIPRRIDERAKLGPQTRRGAPRRTASVELQVGGLTVAAPRLDDCLAAVRRGTCAARRLGPAALATRRGGIRVR